MFQGRTPWQLLLQGGLSASHCYPPLPSCPPSPHKQLFFQRKLRAETVLVRSYPSSLVYVHKELWGREGGGLNSLLVCATELGGFLNLSVVDFPMSGVEKQLIFVAKCLKLLGLICRK